MKNHRAAFSFYKRVTALVFFIAGSLSAMEQTPLLLGAVIKKISNTTEHTIRIVTADNRELIIHRNQIKDDLNFALPISTAHADFYTNIFLNNESNRRMILHVTLNPPEEVAGKSLREFVAKLVMKQPKQFNNHAWQQSNKYAAQFFSKGHSAWLFEIELYFSGANLQETQIKTSLREKYTR